jgi:hypothetical protein
VCEFHACCDHDKKFLIVALEAGERPETEHDRKGEKSHKIKKGKQERKRKKRENTTEKKKKKGGEQQKKTHKEKRKKLFSLSISLEKGGRAIFFFR